jgi:uncharacterized membrane protein
VFAAALSAFLSHGCASDANEPGTGPEFAISSAATAMVVGTPLADLGAGHSSAQAISRRGQIAGHATDAAGGQTVLLHPQLSILPSNPTGNYGVRALSELAGGGTIAVGVDAVWTQHAGGDWSAAVPLPHIGGGGQGYGVNSSGTVVGYVHPATGPQVQVDGGHGMPTGASAAVWKASEAGALELAIVPGLPGCSSHWLQQINDAGQAVGWSACPSGRTNVSRPFVMSGGEAHALPMGPYASVAAYGISQVGHVAGMSHVGRRTTAVLLWTPAADGTYGAPQHIVDIDLNTGWATGVNSCGAIVGRRAANDDIQGFVATAQGVIDLYPIPGGEQAYVDAINDAGTVVGFSWAVTGSGRKKVAVRKATMWQVAGC